MRRVGRKDWEDESDQTMYEFSYPKKSDLSGGLFQLSAKRTRSSEASEETVEYHRTRKNLKKKKLEQSTQNSPSVEESTKSTRKNVGRTRKKDVEESTDVLQPVNAVACMKGRLKTGKRKVDRVSLDTKEEESSKTGKSNVEETESSEKAKSNVELLPASQQVECLDEDSESGDEMNFCPPPPAQGLSLMDMARRYGERVTTFSSSHKETTDTHFEIQHRSFSLQSADFLCGFMNAAATAASPPSPVAPSPSVRQFCTNPNVSNALSELGGGGMCGSWEFPPDQPLRAALGSYVEGVLDQMLTPEGDVFSARDVLRFSFNHLSPGEREAVAMLFEDPDERLHLSSLVRRLTLVALVVVFRSFNARPH